MIIFPLSKHAQVNTAVMIGHSWSTLLLGAKNKQHFCIGPISITEGVHLGLGLIWSFVFVCGLFLGVHPIVSVHVCVLLFVCTLWSTLFALFVSWLRFTVRDFYYNEEEMKADKEEMTRLSTDKKKQFVRAIFSLYSSV